MTQRVDTLPIPPGFRVQGRRTLYVDPCEALAALGVEDTPETRVAAAVMALEAARYYALALAMGGGPAGPAARWWCQLARICAPTLFLSRCRRST
jgi:hypothetical protein